MIPFPHPFVAPVRVCVCPSFPQVLPAQRIVPKVDDVPMVSVSWARVHLLSADVGKNCIPIARLFRDETVHLGERRCDPFRIGVVEGESHAKNDAALKALAGIRLDARRIVVPPAVEEERGDRVHRFAFEELYTGEVPLVYVKYTYHYGGESRPRHTPPCTDRSHRRCCRSNADQLSVYPLGRWYLWQSGRMSRPCGAMPKARRKKWADYIGIAVRSLSCAIA